MGKQIRIDQYWGWRDEGGPRDRSQIIYDLDLHDLDDVLDAVRLAAEEAIAELINDFEEGIDESQE